MPTDKNITPINLFPVFPRKLFISKNGAYNVTKYDGVFVKVSESLKKETLNIHYGNTAPVDTSKLWIKGNKAQKVVINSEFTLGGTTKTNTAQLPIAAISMGCVAIGSKIYTFGGSRYNLPIDDICVFDTETQTAKVLEAKLEQPCVAMGCACVDKKVYLFGGCVKEGKFIDDIYCFNADTETIEKLDVKLNANCSSVSAVTVDTDIYLLGGLDGKYKKLKSVYRFDTTTQLLYEMSYVLPYGVYDAGCVAVDKRIYLIGGYSTGSSDRICSVDTATGEAREEKTKLPYALTRTGCAESDGLIYILGGNIGTDSSDKIYLYNPDSGIITDYGSLPKTIEAFGGVKVNDIYYIIAGSSVRFLTAAYAQDIHSFVLKDRLPGNVIAIQTGSSNRVKIYTSDTAEIYANVEYVYRGDKSGIARKENAFVCINGAWKKV